MLYNASLKLYAARLRAHPCISNYSASTCMLSRDREKVVDGSAGENIYDCSVNDCNAKLATIDRHPDSRPLRFWSSAGLAQSGF